MKHWNRIPEPGTTISGFADNKKKKNNNPDRPTCDSKHTYYFFGLNMQHERSKSKDRFTQNQDNVWEQHSYPRTVALVKQHIRNQTKRIGLVQSGHHHHHHHFIKM